MKETSFTSQLIQRKNIRDLNKKEIANENESHSFRVLL